MNFTTRKPLYLRGDQTNQAMLQPFDHGDWLRSFERAKGRKLRVLHIGNIANNAYLAAKFLRCVGVEADVLAYDYYHVMGMPEWEELSITRDYGDDFRPRFSDEDIGMYQRPRWFVSGPLIPCVNYLMAVRSGDQERSKSLWTLLERARLGDLPKYSDTDVPNGWSWRDICSSLIMLPYRVARQTAKIIHRSLRARGFERASQSFYRWALGRGVVRNTINRLVTVSARVGIRKSHLVRFNELMKDFKNLFPERSDQLSFSDFAAYLDRIEPLEKLFSQYDIVQAYATDPILPLICGKKPFVAFEHGTLRDFIREDDPLHRLTALAYRKADHVFVTNGDCREHAQWLGCENATAMLHPIDVDLHRQRDEVAIAVLRKRYNADVLLFCPIRHDWSVKGTDMHIRALPEICARVAGRVVLVLAPWGFQVEDSRCLVRALGCQASVVWLDRPLSRIELVRHMQAADVVLDQMSLPHFGATAPQSLAAGTPVIMSYRPESTAWIVSEPAPILPAFSPEDVAKAVDSALNPTWRADFKERARTWVDIHHHNNRMVDDHLTAYRRILKMSDIQDPRLRERNEAIALRKT